MAHDVFISYSSADKPAADAACAALEARGIRCWIAPRDIKPSENWAAAIVEAIREAQIFLLVFSRHANESDQVKREVERAANSGKQLLTLRIEDVSPQAALEYYLNTPHWLDAITPPFQTHLEKLADACTSLLTLPHADQASTTGADTKLSSAPKQVALQSVSSQHNTPKLTTAEKSPATRSKRTWLIAALAVIVVVVAGGGLLVHHVMSPNAGGELILTLATDPGPNPFMPPAASPPPPNTQAPPTLQAHTGGNTVATQPLPGDREGLYGGTVNNAESNRDQMIAFLTANPPQAGAFIDSLNSDPTLYWGGGHPLTVGDIAAYLRELTPVVLRLDTRVTNHGFAGSHATDLEAVLQAGTAVLVDGHGVPRVRSLSGSPLTAPIALKGTPTLVGTPWPGFRAGALGQVEPTTAAITVFVLVDIVTGQAFNRPAGSTGADDTSYDQPIAAPQSTPATTTTGQDHEASIAGTYLWHYVTYECYGMDDMAQLHATGQADFPTPITLEGNMVKVRGFAGPLNPDGSFSNSGPNGPYDYLTVGGVFATDGGRTVIRDGTWDDKYCHATWTATKQ